ncbi:hypothetical protein IFR05_001008 [Cadophora sp. M221]|nr:hypothetical protein IFR05_001008 [Cadophora sp. M221]
MDPLSIAASIVALITAGNKIAGALERLVALRGAPASIHALNNELSDLRLVLSEAELLLAEHKNRDTGQGTQGCDEPVEKPLFPSLQRVWDRLQELQAIEKRLTTRSGNVDRLAWIWEQDNICKAQKGLRAARIDVIAILGLISSKSTFRIEAQLQEVQSMAAAGNANISQSINLQADTMRLILDNQRRHDLNNSPSEETASPGADGKDRSGMRRRPGVKRTYNDTPGTGQSFLQVNYFFPGWFLQRAVTFSLRMSDFERPEYSLKLLHVRSTFESIFRAAGINDAAMVRSLIANNRASVLDVTNDDGHSALHLAVMHSHIEAVKVLLEMKAEPYLENSTQETPYDMAWSTILCYQDTPNASKWRVEEMRALFPSLGSIEERRRFTKIHKIINRILHCDLEKTLSNSPELINQVDADGRTALSYAAARGDPAALQALIQYGADPNIPDRIGQGPLRQSMKASESTCTRLLLEAGARVNHRDNWQQTALISSVFHPRPLPFISTLLRFGAHVNATDFQGSTVLMEAMKFNADESVQLLLDHGARVNELDHFGISAFMHGVRHNSHAALRVLLGSGFQITYSGSGHNRSTVLHWVAETGDKETLQILAEIGMQGVHAEDKTESGLTAIDIAEKRRELERMVDEQSVIDSEWLMYFQDLLETLQAPPSRQSPRSILSGKSDASEEVFHDALQHISFEKLSEMAEEGEIKHPVRVSSEEISLLLS